MKDCHQQDVQKIRVSFYSVRLPIILIIVTTRSLDKILKFTFETMAALCGTAQTTMTMREFATHRRILWAVVLASALILALWQDRQMLSESSILSSSSISSISFQQEEGALEKEEEATLQNTTLPMNRTRIKEVPRPSSSLATLVAAARSWTVGKDFIPVVGLKIVDEQV